MPALFAPLHWGSVVPLDHLGWMLMLGEDCALPSKQLHADDLCQVLADFAKRLCISLLDPRGLAPFLACRLIALDKCPGVRPIGIRDTARRIIAKAVLAVIREDVQDAAGSAQLCAGQISGCEAAVHSVRESFQLEDTEAALLVDASNAFNSINRMSTLKNIQLICPPFANILINCYRDPTKLFIDAYIPRKEQHRGIHWACQCMPLLQCHS